jgi:hypothetical protein
VEVDSQDLTSANLRARFGNPIAIRTSSALTADANSNAQGSFRRIASQGGAANVKIVGFAPSMSLGSLGNINNVIVAESNVNVFQSGTSGAIWRIGGMLAGIQLGTEKKNGKFRGYAQALFSIVDDWIPSRFANRQVTVLNSL